MSRAPRGGTPDDDPLSGPLAVVADELAGPHTGGVDAAQIGLDDLEDEAFDPAAVAERNPRPTRRRRGGRQSEAQLVREVLDHLGPRPDVFARKVVGTSAGGGGEPDLDVCVRLATGIGRSVKIELKVGSNRPTAIQTRRLLQWQDAGALVGWATSLVQVQQILERAEDPQYRWEGGPGAPAAAQKGHQ